MLLFQVHGMVKAFQRGTLIADLLVECGEGSLVLDGDGGLPRRAAPLGFTIRRDGLLEFSLGDAARSKQANQRGVVPHGSSGKRAQGCLDPHRIPVAQGLAVLLEQTDEPVPVLGLACQIDRVEGIGIRTDNERCDAPATQVL